MSLTIAFDHPRTFKTAKHWGQISGNATFDSSYPTGGEAANGISGKFKSCKEIICEPSSGYYFAYDKTNDKLLAYVPVSAVAASGVAGANNTLISANGRVEVSGAGTNQQVAGSQVLDTSNLSTVVTHFIAYGAI